MRLALLLTGAVLAAAPSNLFSQSRPGSVDLLAGPSIGSWAGFGVALAVDGDRLIVGRPGAFTFGLPAPPTAPGGVHVFARSPEGEWTESARVDSPGEIGDGFGQSVAVWDNLMAVGVPGAEEGRGQVIVYERPEPSGAWTLSATLTALDPTPGDSLGLAVAIAGQTVVAGAPGFGNRSGEVYVFDRDGNGDWSVGEQLTVEWEDDQDRFGAALAATPDVIAVGAPGGFPSLVPGGGPPNVQPGSVQLFERSESGGWTSSESLDPWDPGPASMGWAVALQGNDLLVGSPLANQFSGVASHYRRGDDGTWSRVAVLTPEEPVAQGGFGMGLAWAGRAAAVGAPLSGSAAGSLYLFEHDAQGEWSEVRVVSPQAGIGFFGAPIAGSGDLILAGAPAQAFSGSARVLVRGTDGTWSDEAVLTDPSGGLEPIVGAPAECDDQEGRVHGYDCTDVDLVSFLPVSALGGGPGVIVNDVWGWTDPTTQREYAIVGRNEATAFVDVTDAANPRYLGHLPLTEGATPNMWRDMKVYADHVFIVADGAGPHGVQVFDLTQLRDVGPAPVTFQETAHYDGIFSAHNIVINESTGIAYAVGASMGGETCGGGLHMIDVREPTNPTFLGCFSDAETGLAGTGYSHDAQCIVYEGPDVDYQGREICFGANENAVSISDVTDKDNPVAVSRAAYPNSAYLHQGWVSDDHRYFYMNDEGDEVAGLAPRTRTLVWDIEDLDDPVLLDEHMGTTAASDHNLYVQGRFMYQSNYVSGLRILDVSDPANIREVGYFDTVGGEDAPGFAGSWSNYPFFSSGVILVTSINEGLFLLKKRQRPVS